MEYVRNPLLPATTLLCVIFVIHIKCNFVSKDLYNQFIDENSNPSIEENDKSNWICIHCINSNLAFGHLDEKSFHLNSKGITNNCNLDNFNFSLHPSDKQITEQICKPNLI